MPLLAGRNKLCEYRDFLQRLRYGGARASGFENDRGSGVGLGIPYKQTVARARGLPQISLELIALRAGNEKLHALPSDTRDKWQSDMSDIPGGAGNAHNPPRS